MDHGACSDGKCGGMMMTPLIDVQDTINNVRSVLIITVNRPIFTDVYAKNRLSIGHERPPFSFMADMAGRLTSTDIIVDVQDTHQGVRSALLDLLDGSIINNVTV
jgi:hypothetical protein